MRRLEGLIRSLTSEINGQFPRPWMTDLSDPSRARVFVVGYNPASAYRVGEVDHERHIDALFNRRGQNCRQLYAELTKQSPTRGNIELFVEKLASVGVTAVLETNVICYSTGKKDDLLKPEHAGGRERGIKIFRCLLEEIKPSVIVLHGVGVAKEFSRAVERVPRPPDVEHMFVSTRLSSGAQVFVIPSLAMPGYQNWPKKPLASFCNWAGPYLDRVASLVSEY